MKKQQKSLKQLGVKKIDEAFGIAEYRLENGLKVLLKENHSAPVASFMVVYKVGSRNEGVGHTGSTHFLEHMMFKGTKKFSPEKGNGVMETFSRIGAVLNATTWMDRTNYFECVGSEHLALCIEIEADRMRNLNLRQEDRNSEMTVVRNEFERGENDPGDALDKELNAIAFREHPYHHPTIGWRSDVEGVPMSRLKDFYDTYYWPDNTTVIIVGDFETKAALELISKFFGKIPAAPHELPQVYTVEPPQEGERRFKLQREGDLPMVVVAYHIPQADHQDTYALAALRAILGDQWKSSSRLYKGLMNSGLATSCSSRNGEFRDPSLFEVGATLTSGTSFDTIEKAIYKELERLATEPVSEDELRRVKSANRKGTVLSAADPLSFTNLLCQAEASASWKWAMQYDDNFDAVTPADIMRVATKYFKENNRTVGHFIPKEPNDGNEPVLIAPSAHNSPKPAVKPARGKAAAAKKAERHAPVKPVRMKLAKPKGTRPSFASQVVREVLPNGLTVLAMKNPGTGSVSVQGAFYAGDYYHPQGKEELPSIVADMLTKGSKNYSKEQLAELLEEMGTHLAFRTDKFRSAFGTLIAAPDLPPFIRILSDVIKNPIFMPGELSQTKREFHASLVRAVNNTSQRANNAFMQNVYPEDHPFHPASFEDSIKQLENISEPDLAEFHHQHYSPKTTILTIVGDVEPTEAINLVKLHFGEWKGVERKPIVIPEALAPQATKRIDIPLADKRNVDIVIGLPTPLSRGSKDYYAAYLANAALGQDTISSRLGKVVRVKHGLTYGIYSYFDDASFGAAPWGIGLSVNPDNIEAALKLVDQVVADYKKKGISEDELEDGANRVVGTFNVQFRSSAGIAQTLTRFEFIGLGVAGMDSFTSDVYAVTRADVNKAIQTYIRPQNALTVIAGVPIK